MKKRVVYFGMLITLFFSGCRPAPQSNSQEHLLQAVSWYQNSAEMKAIYIQSFSWALKIVKEKLEQNTSLPLAVILDIDETVLNNSPQTAQQIIDGVPFSKKMWDEWCQLTEAEALPGALTFTVQAAEMGVELFYISNRGNHLLNVTIDNLKSAGFPFADAKHVLLKTDSSAKDERRSRVSLSHEVILLIGDNLGDFSGIFDERQHGVDMDNVMANSALFGRDYIILPNPLYGGWEKPFRGESPEESNLNKRNALNYYRR